MDVCGDGCVGARGEGEGQSPNGVWHVQVHKSLVVAAASVHASQRQALQSVRGVGQQSTAREVSLHWPSPPQLPHLAQNLYQQSAEPPLLLPEPPSCCCMESARPLHCRPFLRRWLFPRNHPHTSCAPKKMWPGCMMTSSYV